MANRIRLHNLRKDKNAHICLLENEIPPRFQPITIKVMECEYDNINFKEPVKVLLSKKEVIIKDIITISDGDAYIYETDTDYFFAARNIGKMRRYSKKSIVVDKVFDFLNYNGKLVADVKCQIIKNKYSERFKKIVGVETETEVVWLLIQ